MNEFKDVSTPVFICEMEKLERNLKVLDQIQKESGAKILLSLKGFALYESFGLIRTYLSGASASSLNETKLAAEKFKKELHTYLPAYKEEEVERIAMLSDTVIFNSLEQWHCYYPLIKESASCGVRLNLELPFNTPPPCNPNRLHSRLGVRVPELLLAIPKGLEGLHIHALCAQNSDALEQMIEGLEKHFSPLLKKLKWLNLGGGHSMTHDNYDTKHLIKIVQALYKRYPQLSIYLEPSEAVVHESGVLVTTVLDVIHNGIDIAILDISVEVHMTDLLITKVTPNLRESSPTGSYVYELAGVSCAAGDVFGTYAFEAPLSIGQTLVFENQMQYSMVKTTSFNGINAASIAIKERDGTLRMVKEFGYADYLRRL